MHNRTICKFKETSKERKFSIVHKPIRKLIICKLLLTNNKGEPLCV